MIIAKSGIPLPPLYLFRRMSEYPSLRLLALRACVKNSAVSFSKASVACLGRLQPSPTTTQLKLDVVRALSTAAAWFDDILPESFFENLPITVLSFASCSLVSPAYLLRVAGACPALRGLDATSCFYLLDSHVSDLVDTCPNLRYLNITDCRKLTDGALEAIIQRGAALRHVDLGGCGGITRAGVIDFLSRAPAAAEWTGLGLSGTEGLDGDALDIIASRFTSLRRLSVGYAFGGDDPLIAALKVNERTLVTLEVNWPRGNITDELALLLTSKPGDYPNLRFLNFQGVKGVSIDGLCALVNCHPRPAGLALPYWDNYDILEWHSSCGLEASGASSESSMAVDGKPTLLDLVGPGIVHVVSRFSGLDGTASPLLKDYIAKSGLFVKVD
jgi:hypothetical protein